MICFQTSRVLLRLLGMGKWSQSVQFLDLKGTSQTVLENFQSSDPIASFQTSRVLLRLRGFDASGVILLRCFQTSRVLLRRGWNYDTDEPMTRFQTSRVLLRPDLTTALLTKGGMFLDLKGTSQTVDVQLQPSSVLQNGFQTSRVLLRLDALRLGCIC